MVIFLLILVSQSSPVQIGSTNVCILIFWYFRVIWFYICLNFAQRCKLCIIKSKCSSSMLTDLSTLYRNGPMIDMISQCVFACMCIFGQTHAITNTFRFTQTYLGNSHILIHEYSCTSSMCIGYDKIFNYAHRVHSVNLTLLG